MADSTTHLEQIETSQAQKEVTANGLFDAASPAMIFGRHMEACAGLEWGYYGGRWGGVEIDNGTLTLEPSTDNYIVVHLETGVVVLADSDDQWNDPDYAHLYMATTGASTVTSYEDHRCGPSGLWGGGSSAGGNTDTDEGGNDAPLTPDTHPSSPNVADDEFETGASIDTSGIRGLGATAWSWVNQGSATAAQSSGILVLAAPSSGSNNLRMVVQALSGSSWKYRAKMSSLHGAVSNYYHAGMVLRNSGSSRIVSFHKVASGSDVGIGVNRWTNETTFSAAPISGTNIFSPATYARSARHPMYLEMELAAGTVTFRYSDVGADGTFISIGTESIATFLSTVDQIGLFTDTANSNAAWGAWDWFRRVA